MKTNLLIVCHFKSTRFFKIVFDNNRGQLQLLLLKWLFKNS
jgi:hypothetical protein